MGRLLGWSPPRREQEIAAARGLAEAMLAWRAGAEQRQPVRAE
jgi:hypothetical protein